MLSKQVEGRVATELDPRLAHDKGAPGRARAAVALGAGSGAPCVNSGARSGRAALGDHPAFPGSPPARQPLGRPPPPTHADGLVARAKAISALYAEMGVPAAKLIFRLPATWAGIQAAAALEAGGVATQVFHIYRRGAAPEGLGFLFGWLLLRAQQPRATSASRARSFR